MNSLDKATKTRVVTAVECTEFRTFQSFRKDMAEARKVLEELKETTEIDEGVGSELAYKFRLISMESADSTVGIRDAAPELHAFCRKRLPKFELSERDVKREILKHCNLASRLDFERFQAIFESYEQQYSVSGSLNEVPREIEERFSEAAHAHNSIDVEAAIFVLRNLHFDSGNGDASEVSFFMN